MTIRRPKTTLREQRGEAAACELAEPIVAAEEKAAASACPAELRQPSKQELAYMRFLAASLLFIPAACGRYAVHTPK